MSAKSEFDFKTKFLRDFAFDCFSGGSVAFLFAWFLDFTVGETLQKHAVYLVSFLGSMVAASLALMGTLSTIENQNSVATKAEKSARVASKAVLPLVLTKLNQVAITGTEVCLRLNLGESDLRAKFRQTQLPVEIVSDLKEAIRFATETDQEILADLLRTYQVMASRTQIWVDVNNNRDNLNPEDAIQWAFFIRQIENCFEYARGGEMAEPLDSASFNLRPLFSMRVMAPDQVLAQLEPVLSRVDEGRLSPVFPDKPSA